MGPWANELEYVQQQNYLWEEGEDGMGVCMKVLFYKFWGRRPFQIWFFFKFLAQGFRFQGKF